MAPRSTSTALFCRRAHDQLACCNTDFLRRESAILRARAPGGGEQGRPGGLLRREIERVTIYGERASVVVRMGVAL
jgi:hypothetical protein